MDAYKCFLCFSKFNEVEKVICHLRKEHRVKPKINEIKCILNNPVCKKKFQTWSGLKKHILNCTIEVNENTEREISNLNFEACTIPDVRNETIVENDNVRSNKISIAYQRSPEPNNNAEKCTTEDTSISRMKASVRQCADKIENLEVAQNVKNNIFDLIENLLSEAYMFNCNSIRNATRADGIVFEVLENAFDCVINEVKKYDSAYKRNKISEKNMMFVKPNDMAIGTHWETKRDSSLQKMIPVHTQSIFQYVSITNTLKTLFLRDEFKQLYLEYNSKSTGNRHVCTPGIFKDFCCGHIYKRNELFRHHPESIQIQIFTDGFEMCQALKSKANLHSQVSFYFTIRNLPPQFAFNLQNIHLVALCNANDLKSPHTDYNNIWKVIVDDLYSLESEGIEIGDGIKLKGNYCTMSIFTLKGRFENYN